MGRYDCGENAAYQLAHSKSPSDYTYISQQAADGYLLPLQSAGHSQHKRHGHGGFRRPNSLPLFESHSHSCGVSKSLHMVPLSDRSLRFLPTYRKTAFIFLQQRDLVRSIWTDAH